MHRETVCSEFCDRADHDGPSHPPHCSVCVDDILPPAGNPNFFSFAALEERTSLIPPANHSAIAQVSGQLFRDGHYKQAALEAYIRVIDEVKRKSGLALDGDSLVNRAFGCENQTPVIQFNTLQTDAERDEQKGIMFLFKGIVGLRNSKAHSNRFFNDPRRAHEYLALAGLLMRLLEIAAVSRTP